VTRLVRLPVAERDLEGPEREAEIVRIVDGRRDLTGLF
jgi:hypothetical protein